MHVIFPNDFSILCVKMCVRVYRRGRTTCNKRKRNKKMQQLAQILFPSDWLEVAGKLVKCAEERLLSDEMSFAFVWSSEPLFLLECADNLCVTVTMLTGWHLWYIETVNDTVFLVLSIHDVSHYTNNKGKIRIAKTQKLKKTLSNTLLKYWSRDENGTFMPYLKSNYT